MGERKVNKRSGDRNLTPKGRDIADLVNLYGTLNPYGFVFAYTEVPENASFGEAWDLVAEAAALETRVAVDVAISRRDIDSGAYIYSRYPHGECGPDDERAWRLAWAAAWRQWRRAKMRRRALSKKSAAAAKI